MGDADETRQIGPSIGIVDNDELTLMTLSHYLQSGLHASVWCATLGAKAISLCSETTTAPDVLLVDMSLNDMTGEQVIERVRASGCIVPILAVTSFPLHRYAGRVAAAGAQGIVAKRSLRTIRSAIIALLSAGTWASDTDAVFHAVGSVPATPANELKRHEATGVAALSPRERAVLTLFSQGFTNDQTAAHLNVSSNTVKTYATRAFAKLGAHNRSQAVALWLAPHGSR